MTSRGYTILSVLTLLIIAVGTYAHSTLPATAALGTVHCAPRTERMPNITARAAHVYDIKGEQVLFSKHDEAQLPLASLTKLATAIVAADTLDATETLTISEDALTPEGDSGLFYGEQWGAQDLIDFTLMTSSNDGARALALAAGSGSIDGALQHMNTLATRIGTSQMFFLNETGLDVSSTTAGAYGSARDVGRLLTYAYTHTGDALFGSAQTVDSFTSRSGITHRAVHTADIAGNPGQVIVKTGFTDLAGGNLAVLTEVLPGRPVAIVVLGATRETREADVLALTAAARAAVKRATLCGTSL